MAHTVLQVPVPALEPFVRSRTEHYDAAYLSRDPTFVHAHVTALGPFVPPTSPAAYALDQVGEIACLTSAFDFTLAGLGTFPNGIIHLLPEPDAGFRGLTARLCAAFPDYPPYAAEFPDVLPHLTLDAVSDEVSQASTLALLGPIVPVRCRAERLDLVCYEPGACRVIATWPLGRPGEA